MKHNSCPKTEVKPDGTHGYLFILLLVSDWILIKVNLRPTVSVPHLQHLDVLEAVKDQETEKRQRLQNEKESEQCL
jgi:hypothetical protein